MAHHLVELEQEALNLMNGGNYKEAIKLYEKIIDENPNWEFGVCFYDMAHCFEELGELEEAKKNYLKAIEYDDEDSIRLGGYASFLYLHGEPKQALDAYLKLLTLKKQQHLDTSRILIAIETLAKKIGLSDKEIAELVT